MKIAEREVKKVIEKLETGKAGDLDGWTNEMIKAGGE